MVSSSALSSIRGSHGRFASILSPDPAGLYLTMPLLGDDLIGGVGAMEEDDDDDDDDDEDEEELDEDEERDEDDEAAAREAAAREEDEEEDVVMRSSFTG